MNEAAIIALITGLAPLANNIITWISQAQATLKQSAELTPEQEKALDAAIASIDIPAAWKVDSNA